MPMSFGGVSKQKVATVIVAADGTGDTTDIQTGINLLPATGGVVYIKEGIYTITSEITIQVNGTSIIGAGNSTQIKSANALNGFIFTNGKVNVSVESLRVEKTGAVGGIGIYATGVDSFVAKCIAENLNAGISLSADRIRASNNDCSLSLTGIATGALTSGCTIVNNDCSNNTSTGINIQGPKNSIMNNSCSSNGVEGISISGGGKCPIIGNICTGNDNWGIYVVEGSDRCMIIGNICADSTINDGIYLEENCDRHIISGNICTGNDDYGINISDAACDNNIVTSNVCINNTIGQINDAGTGTISDNNVIT